MTGKNFDLSLRVNADFNDAQKNAQAFSQSIDEIAESAKSTTGAASTMADSAEKAAAKFTYAGKSSFSLRDILRSTSATVKDQAVDVDRLLATYDAASAASLKLAQDSTRLKQAFDQGKISQEQYERAAANIARRNQALGASFNGLRGQMSNIGFQLQDIAVQAQMGVNPLIILSQQGSQLVSGLNPLAGAIIAVGGAVAGALLPSLFSAGSAAEELEAKIKDLDEEYKNLTESQRQFLRDQEATKQSKISKEIDDQTEKVKNLSHQLKILEETRNAPLRPAAGLPAGLGGASYLTSTDEQEAEITKRITQARAELDVQTKALADSKEELRRINGETIIDEKTLAKQARETIERLKEETDTYKLAGAQLGEYVAEKFKAQGATRDEIIALYEKQEAQRKATEAEREAAQEEKRREGEAKAKLKSAEDYVKSLERQAVVNSKNTEKINEYEIAERGLTGALLERARAAQAQNLLEKDRLALAELNIQLLRAQGNEQAAAQTEFESKYSEMLERLKTKGNDAGVKIIEEIINLRALDARLGEMEKSFKQTLDAISREENSINVQRQAGLISEYEARQRIYELHQKQAQKLEAMRPDLEALSKKPGEVGKEATEALETLDEQLLRLRSTMTLLESTLRDGLEAGLTDAILGLADGTKSFSDAVRSVGAAVAQALAEMAAQALAQQIVGGLFGAAGANGGGLFTALGFSNGGYTGEGGKYEIAGVVHRGEGVLSQEDISALGGPNSFFALRNALRNGYSDGGLAGIPAPALPSPATLTNSPLPSATTNTTLQNSQNFYLVDDPSKYGDFMKSPAGRESLIVTLKRNPGEFRSVLNIPHR
ncbi:MAG TPA: phage tail length tape measure family protein [Cellvibrio sp.]|nr:phage tail length tape measure family protein [Cellvibrio sp.]